MLIEGWGVPNGAGDVPDVTGLVGIEGSGAVRQGKVEGYGWLEVCVGHFCLGYLYRSEWGLLYRVERGVRGVRMIE